MTTNMELVRSKMSQNNKIIIVGPKGCGKTILCSMLYRMCEASGDNCIFLTVDS